MLARRVSLAAGLALAMPIHAARPQGGRPLAIVVPYPAGGDTDATARLLAERLAARIGRPTVVENRAGASGTIGTLHVARATPDGNTLLLVPSTFATAPHVLRRGANYHPLEDFVPIALTTTAPLLLVASRSAGITSVAEFREAAHAGQVTTYGTPGAGSPMHVLGAMFNRATGLSLAEVSYRGVAPLITDLVAGNIAVGYATPAVATLHVRTGALVPLATSERERSPVMPEVPSFAELGYPDLVLPSWSGVFAPRGAPPVIAAALSAHFGAILAAPDVRARLAELAVVPGSGDPARLAAVVADGYGRIGALVREFGITTE